MLLEATLAKLDNLELEGDQEVAEVIQTLLLISSFLQRIKRGIQFTCPLRMYFFLTAPQLLGEKFLRILLFVVKVLDNYRIIDIIEYRL